MIDHDGLRLRARVVAACAAGLMALVAASHVASPTVIGALGFAVAGCLVAFSGRAADLFARAAVVACVFGLAAAGTVTLASALILLIVAPFREQKAALALVTAAAVIAAAFAAPVVDMGLGGSDGVGHIFAVLVIGAPGLVLDEAATRMLGPIRAAETRAIVRIPALVGLVIGARLGGFDGAAAAIAAAMLATPLALLLVPGPHARARMKLAQNGLGVLAAGLVGLIAVGVAVEFGQSAPIAAAPAALIGLVVYHLALRFHAPAAARRLERLVGRAAAGLAPAAGAKVAQDWQA